MLWSRFILVTGMLTVVMAATVALSNDAGVFDPTNPNRLGRPGVVEAILEGLAYLEDNQVRDRPGWGSAMRDATDEGDGARCRTSFNLGSCKENVGLPLGKVHNRVGEWVSFIHFLPTEVGLEGRTPVAVQDSSLFMTASTAYNLFLFDDSALPPDRQFVSKMLTLALADIQGYKRNEAYNFYPVLPGTESRYPRVGPPNMSMKMMRKMIELQLAFPPGTFPTPLSPEEERESRAWMRTILTRRINPTGIDALFNGPNDADDTALAITIQRNFSLRFPGSGVVPDLAALGEVAYYRDLDRDREHRRNSWKPRNTGAYLTWMKDEREPLFARPWTGIVPRGINDVDAVVNANVAGALAGVGWRELPGYEDSLHLLALVCDERLWPAAGTYYPQYMIFPYAVSRAYRDGGAREEPLAGAVRRLLVRLLDDQDHYARCHPHRRGAFPGGKDESDHFSTALGLCALLNLGRPMACEAGVEERFDRGVTGAVDYLVGVRKKTLVKSPATKQALGGKFPHAAKWESGLFFDTASDLGHWRSEALTAATVLEGLAKFAIGYDQDDVAFGARRVALLPARPGQVVCLAVSN